MIKFKEVSPNKVKRVADMPDTEVYLRVTENTKYFNEGFNQEIKISTIFINKGKIYRYRYNWASVGGGYKGERVICETKTELERFLRCYQPLSDLLTGQSPLTFNFRKGIFIHEMLPWEMM